MLEYHEIITCMGMSNWQDFYVPDFFTLKIIMYESAILIRDGV